MERSLNKVYINPNFSQRSSVTSAPHSSKTYMHVNPNFPPKQIHENLDNNLSVTKRRIFVNPNFIPSNNAFSAGGSTGIKYHSVSQPFNAVVQTNPTRNNLVINRITHPRFEDVSARLTTKEIAEPIVTTTVTNSRYTLVRRKTDACVDNVERPINKNNCTVKINKYKSVRLSFIKNNLPVFEKSKEFASPTQLNRSLNPKTTSSSAVNRKYTKINKQSASVKKVAEVKATSKRTLLTKSNALNSSFQTNGKMIIGKFKKNNIPCPSFSKFGKCLRNVRGNCEFLHDKKHVSLCRKFLKGICHDSSCRFSHELSAKKMPTCYFYLNGMCTKENCPYLHVKLNNDTKICNEFLKGYCEKGDKCEYRHVNKNLKTLIKHSMNIQRQYSCASPIVVSNKAKIKTKQNIYRKNDTKRKSLSNTKLSSQDENETECRYFKENNKATEQNEVCDVIKPSRCKLGTLPSFIKL